MYNIRELLTYGPTSSAFKPYGPSYHPTDSTCHIVPLSLPELTETEKSAIRNEGNKLWQEFGTGISKVIGSCTNKSVIDAYSAAVIMSVCSALRLLIYRKPQSNLQGVKADYLVVANIVGGRMHEMLIGCVEDKFPNARPEVETDKVVDHNDFCVQLYGQMMQVANYYGTRPVFGIGSTGFNWRFFRLLDDTFSCNENRLSISNKDTDLNHSPLANSAIEPESSGVDDRQIDDMQIDSSPIALMATKVYRFDDIEMLYALGSVLKEMYAATWSRPTAGDFSWFKGKNLLVLYKTDTVTAWKWLEFTLKKAQYGTMMKKSSTSVWILSFLGRGSDGRVFLVADIHGAVAALKFIHPEIPKAEQVAEHESQIWHSIYSDYMVRFTWNVRMEVWMGQAAVVLPFVYQFSTEHERLANLEKVRVCLDIFQSKGYVHKDIYWRNIGYVRDGDEIVVIVIDLNPVRGFKQKDLEPGWIDTAIEDLKRRATIEEVISNF